MDSREQEAKPSGGGLVGLAFLGCGVALVGLFVTAIATDSGWSDAIWSDGSSSWLAWSVAGVGCIAAGVAVIEAIKRRRNRRRVLIALGVEALAAVVWIALGFAATAA